MALFNRGSIYYVTKKPRLAIIDLTKLIETTDPVYVQVFKSFRLRAKAYSCLGKTEEAIADWTRVLEMDRVNFEAYRERGLASAKLGNYQSAVKDFRSLLCLTEKEEVVEILYYRAKWSCQLGDFENACKNLMSCFKNEGVEKGVGLIFRLWGDFEDNSLISEPFKDEVVAVFFSLLRSLIAERGENRENPLKDLFLEGEEPGPRPRPEETVASIYLGGEESRMLAYPSLDYFNDSDDAPPPQSQSQVGGCRNEGKRVSVAQKVKTVICGGCGIENTKMQRCGRCRSVRYCSRDCQKRHWSTHKRECRTAERS